MISVADVKKIADLIKLVVTGDEEKLAGMFTDTLDKVAVLKELDTPNVDETFQVTGLVNVFQEESDETATLTKDQALLNAGEVINGLFATRAVLDRNSDAA